MRLGFPDKGINTQPKGRILSTMVQNESPERSYDRTWAEIEAMLDQAEVKMKEWKAWYETCKSEDDQKGMKEAARNHKALQGVVKTLKWTLGERGISDPLN